MKVLSLFDGMACGMLAMQAAGIDVDRYVAFEIDKYAVQTSTHNSPMIEHRGDVFKADFTEFRGFDFLVGGSPCTYWSIAQKNNRETEASGMGWELFSQYVRALKEAQPMYFIYENNKSMANAIRESITETFGFEPICINSALVSAQNRQRLYWVGRRNPDGTYSRVKVDQPEDRGILLRDVLDNAVAWQDKSFAYTTRCQSATPMDTLTKHRHTMVAEPVAINTTAYGKAQCLRATCYKDGVRNLVGNDVDRRTGVAVPVAINTTANGEKARTLMAGYYKYGTATLITNEGFTGGTTAVAEPVASTVLNVNPSGKGINGAVGRIDAKSRCLTTNKGEGQKIIVPVCVAQRGRYADTGKRSTKGQGKIDQFYEARQDGKTNALTTVQKDNAVCCPVEWPFAVPVEWDENDKPTKAMSGADGKTYIVYEVKDGQITIKGKRYSIKLADGFYIIRKLTVSECKRLQTVPEWYEFPVSNSQAYKMLGNGWTVEVIAHLINATQTAEVFSSERN